MTTALITGSAGFLGRHFHQQLVNRGWTVARVDLATGYDAFDLFAHDTFAYDLVIHAAALAPHRAAIDGKPIAATYNAHLDATLFHWAAVTRQRHVLYLSSSAVYSDDLAVDEEPFTEDEGSRGEPFDRYGAVKRNGEHLAQMARDCGVNVTVVRPFSGYGAGQSTDFPFGAFIARAKHREDPFTIWGSADQVRDWVHVDDIVAGSLALVDNGVRGPVNICTGRATSMRQLAGLVCQAAGYRPRIRVDADAPMGVAYRVGDPTRLHLWYRPRVTLEDGVRRAMESHSP